MQLTIHVELVEAPHKHNPNAYYRSRVLLKDEEGYGRAVLALGEPRAAEHESAVRAYEAKVNPR